MLMAQAIYQEPTGSLTSHSQGIVPITYTQRVVGEKYQERATSITSNSECAHHYGIRNQSKWTECTNVDSKQGLSTSGAHQEWYITSDYILGADCVTKMVNLILRDVKIPLTPPPPNNHQSWNIRAQAGIGALTILTGVLDEKVITVSITVVSYTVIVAPVRNPLEVTQSTPRM